MLQRSPSWIKGVIRFVVQETAQWCHVDICKPRETSQEVSWILISPEYASKVCIEEVPVHLPVPQKEKTKTEKWIDLHTSLHHLASITWSKEILKSVLCIILFPLFFKTLKCATEVFHLLQIYNPGLEITVVKSFTHLPLEISRFWHQKHYISSLPF